MAINDNSNPITWTSGNIVWDTTVTHPYTSASGSISKLFPMDKNCPACQSCPTGDHVLASLHWTGAEAVVLLICAECETNIKLDPIEGGYVAFATREMCLSITERSLAGEHIPPDDYELLDWLNTRLLEEVECIKDALALLDTVRARSPHT